MPDQPPRNDPAMNGPTMDDDELILYFYDELPAERRQQVRAQLLDPALRARYDALCADLSTVEQRWEAYEGAEVPEDIASRAWEGVAAKLQPEAPAPETSGASPAPEPSATEAPRQALWMALAASLLIAVATVSFQAGQRSVLPDPSGTLADVPTEGAPGAQTQVSQVRERVLLAQVQRHLGASERLLVDVSNASALQASALGGTLGMTDEALEAERQWARTLLTANRLYRFAAERAGQDRLSDLLGDLEPILIDLANGRGGASPQYVDALRESIATRELLPRVRAQQADGARALSPLEFSQEEAS
ncbi:MAG: hypothetical protein AAF184_12530 [Pseudomonadota bacterium]